MRNTRRCRACGRYKTVGEGLVCRKCFDDWWDIKENIIPDHIPDMEQSQRYMILSCKKNNKLKGRNNAKR